MSESRATRREMLLGSLAAAIAGCTRPNEANAPATPDAGPDTRDLVSAERLAGVTLTPKERQEAVDAIEGQVALIRARHTYRPHNHFPPAHVFDPRLRGYAGPQRERWDPGPVEPRAFPADEADILNAPIAVLGAWIRSGRLSSVELTKLYQRRLRDIDEVVQCVITPTPDLALAQAQRADEELARGRDRGPLHGIPWGAKDLLDTAGIATTWGATPYRDRVPDRDATVVERLHAAGAVMIAKLSLGALAYGDVWFAGETKNPWNPDEGSSGSSAGSAAAVVAGAVGFALGTETLGSIVSPSTRCGATGLRPTFGRVSRAGAMAVAWSLDKIGPITRHAEDAMTVLRAIQGSDPRDPSTTGVPLEWAPRQLAPTSLRVGVDDAWFEGASDAELAGLEALERTGVQRVRVSLPDRPYNALLLNLYAESAAAFEDLTLDDLDDTMVWQDREAWPNTLRMSRFIPAVDFVQADRLRRRVMMDFAALYEDVDALISPSFAGPLLVATNYTGHPSLTLPVGMEKRRARNMFGEPDPAQPEVEVPAALTLWGGLYREDVLVRLGMLMERELWGAGSRPRPRI